MKLLYITILSFFVSTSFSFAQKIELDSLENIAILKQEKSLYSSLLLVLDKKKEKRQKGQVSIARDLIKLKKENEKLKEALKKEHKTDIDTIQKVCKDSTIAVFIGFSLVNISVKEKAHQEKIKAILVVNELNEVYSNKAYSKIETIEDKIKYLEKLSPLWSAKQKIYIDDLVKNIQNELFFIEILEEAYFDLIKSKIKKEDLLELKKYYREDMHQKYIDDRVKEFKFDN